MKLIYFYENFIKTMALYKATITKTQGLERNLIIEKGMSVQFSLVGIPWDGNGPGTQAINDAFLRIYGIDLKTNQVLNPGFVLVEKIG